MIKHSSIIVIDAWHKTTLNLKPVSSCCVLGRARVRSELRLSTFNKSYHNIKVLGPSITSLSSSETAVDSFREFVDSIGGVYGFLHQ